MKRTILATVAGLVLALTFARPAVADRAIIDIESETRGLYPIAVPVGVNSNPKLAKQIAEVLSFDLKVAGWFKIVDPRAFLANLNAERLSIEPTKWKNVGAFGVVKYQVTTAGSRMRITFKLYEVDKGKRAVLEKSYQGSAKDVRKFSHFWANEVVKYFTGEDGFFGSKIAFVSKRRGGGKKVLAMDFDGHGVYSLTRNRYINILPSWSPSGGKVAFTSYMRDNPDLYVVGAGGGRPKRISRHRGMNTGAAFSPDGSKIALTLSKDGNPEIYLISAKNGRIIRRLTRNRAIDTSPSFSPSGKEIAFVSDREGSPQIFVMNVNGSGQRRVSMNGNYNTTPTWSPQKDRRIVAYTTRDGGRFDIVSLDLASGKYTRITQNEGNNEEPSFSPNGRAIAFSSVRRGGSGVYIANSDGTGNAVKVYSGSAMSVDWGPMPRRRR
ncbi:MAG: Tol-Pal system beta propeller repeat protein TolB [Deltaproteobacteria bacterium]|nr:Tol-Pal system beta propeller repeat protein TolB [Deltaproteobacteria bacterium]